MGVGPLTGSRKNFSKTTESGHEPEMIRTYARRRLPKPQQSAGGHVGCEITWRSQHLAAYIHSHLKLEGLHAEPYSLFQNIPHRKRSKGRDLLKKMTKVVDSEDRIEGHTQVCPSKAVRSPNECVTKRRKCKADSSDSEDYTPHSRVCRKQRESPRGITSHQQGTGKRKGEADSSDSETYTPRLRVRGQRRALLQRANSITQQGLLDTSMFQVYFENIWNGISEERRNSFAYLDSLWFNLYTKSSLKEKVLNWIKRKDILSKTYVLVPIIMWSHWSLLILCHFGEESKSGNPCMVLLDSLQSANQSLEPQIRKFVLEIYKMEDMPANRESIRKIPLLVPKLPQQKNGEDCGCYVLFYVNLFLKNAPESFSISDGYPYFMKKDWFTVRNLDAFRQRLGSVPTESFN